VGNAALVRRGRRRRTRRTRMACWGRPRTRGDAATSRCINEKRWHDKRRCEMVLSQQKVIQQPAGENRRQMGGRRQRLRIKRQRGNKNGTTRGDTTTSQGKQGQSPVEQ
jgi:hypothetical protein